MIGPTLRTLRYLRPAQIVHRLWRKARAPWFASTYYRPSRTSERPRPLAPAVWPGDAENGRGILGGRIRLIGLERPFAPPFDWTAADMPLLWRFSLHYFDWLDDLAAAGSADAAILARATVADWIPRHRVVAEPAWHPYPLSLRLFAWLRHAAWLLDGADPNFVSDFTAALDRQARHLPGVVEHDVAGNHVIKNLKALIAAGLAIPGHARSGEHALAMLRREMARQILPDGCHYERSPFYHVQVLRDLLDVRDLLGSAAPGWLVEGIDRMARAFAFFRLGDGLLPLFNDGEIGESALLEAVIARLGSLPEAPAALPDAGYARLARGDTVVLFDAGLCCPDDLPAHAHADTLAFEMSSGGQRIIVNCGTYAYQDAARRNRLRGTPSHSTADIDGLDSAEVYGTFRLGRRPRQVVLRSGTEDGSLFAEGRHDGYRHLGVWHRRHIVLANEQSVSAIDEFTINAQWEHVAHLHFHLHPDVKVQLIDRETAILTVNDRGWEFHAPGFPVRIVDSIFSPRFYALKPTNQLIVEARIGLPANSIGWSLRRR